MCVCVCVFVCVCDLKKFPKKKVKNAPHQKCYIEEQYRE